MKRGRPDDKAEYVNIVLENLNSSVNIDASKTLIMGLNKLNAGELLSLLAHLNKYNEDFDNILNVLPSSTPAQKSRILDTITLHKNLNREIEYGIETSHQEDQPRVFRNSHRNLILYKMNLRA